MKLAFLSFLAVLLAGGLAWPPENAGRGPQPQSAGSSVPVVVELFTSEGCSSCPPADALLAKMETAQPFPGVEIIAIEEHVDYWNQQGWVDPYSSSDWTFRQQVYTSAFREEGPYTPQMVVNGRTPLVGSRAEQAVKAVQEAQSAPATEVKLAAAAAGTTSEPHFTVSIGKLRGQLSPGDSAEVWLAITESGLSSAVARGENAGRNLSHASVLRSLRHIGNADGRGEKDSFEGDASAKLNSKWKRENLTAVVLVQEKKSRRILGAASMKIRG
jgi:hypothetical protein